MTAYTTGTSTGKVDDLVRALGCDSGVSRSTVSRICTEIDTQVEAFRTRPLDHVAFPYVFVDGTYIKARHNHRIVSRAVVVATGVAADGNREVLGLAVGDSEDEVFWTAFLRSLRDRGLGGVRLVISDAHAGLKAAIARVFSGASWQRCKVHLMRNLLATVPRAQAEMVAATVRTVFAQPDAASTRAHLRVVADTLLERFPALSVGPPWAKPGSARVGSPTACSAVLSALRASTATTSSCAASSRVSGPTKSTEQRLEVPVGLPEGLVGVLPNQWIAKAISDNYISSAFTVPEHNVQPASLDLRLGECAYRLRCSFLPGRQTVEEKLAEYVMGEVSLIGGAILERDRPYLIPLMEHLDLPPHVHAKANPRSSTGRVDVFTRAVTDHSGRFDEIAAGYRGGLYLEVVPRSFAVKVNRGLSLNQLRLMVGEASVTDEDLARSHAAQPLLYFNGAVVERPVFNRGLLLSLDLTGDDRGVVGYRAKKNSLLLDLAGSGYDPNDYWEPVVREPQHRVVLEPEQFYLLLSAEAVRIPGSLAAEMAAVDPTSGELRTHYAGFFDPGFGHGVGLMGSRAALEVRAHDVPFVVENLQQVGRLAFERMAEEPTILYGEHIGSSYQQQQVMLSKHFLAVSPNDQLRLLTQWP